jgi:hypothetical protein
MPNILLIAAVKSIFVPGTRSHFLKLLGLSNYDSDFLNNSFVLSQNFVHFCISLINEIVKTCMNSKLFVELKNDKHFSCNSVFSETRLNTSLDTRFSSVLVTVSFAGEIKLTLSNTIQN